MSEPRSAPARLSRPPTSAAGKALRPMIDHRLVERLVERDEHPGDARREGRQPPGERVDAVQADAALGREQRVLAGGAHADAPGVNLRNAHRPPYTQAVMTISVSADRGDAAIAQCQRGIRQSQRAAAGCCSCADHTRITAPRSRMPSAIVVSTAASTASPAIRRISATYTRTPMTRARSGRCGDGEHRMPGEERGSGEKPVRPEHHELAVRQAQHAARAVDQHVAAADQRVDRRQDGDVDRELQAAT